MSVVSCSSEKEHILAIDEKMRIIQTEIPDVVVLEPRIFSDSRGFFLETYNERAFAAMGIAERFVQDNQSYSKQGVLRGLHFQVEQAQGKLVRVVAGEVFDVAVDLRRGSATFGKWTGAQLSSTNHHMIWIPRGFAHGFYTLSETAEVAYKVTDFYAPQHERTLLWNDPDVSIQWPFKGAPILSGKDSEGMRLKDLAQ
jgi:dTDP-4-dehydrorhamnose 3,5-epimerase